MATQLDSLPSLLLVRTTARRGRKAAKRLRAAAALGYLRLRNRLLRRPATGTAPVVVSMTTHGARLKSVAAALESIARGSTRPQRLLLWLQTPEQLRNAPAALRRLERRGVEIMFSPDYGPHTKYYPYVASVERHTVPLVTADDDIIYPRNWLALLADANRRHPDAVCGHWISIIGPSVDGIADYATWARARDTAARTANFAVGVSGVIYPPAMLQALRGHGTGFAAACPGADDIWLKWVALRAGIPVRQVRPAPRHFPMIPGSQGEALMTTNVGESRNDHWIRGLFTAEDVAVLTSSAARHRMD
ncbi:hypothetical protein E7Y32_00700 [Arthrobacter sp. UKPF54-2]|uniref:hypothetical protein n=1 Tax=Arthrobacter sp. UKPF54-2 TaxID=2600159 RepID=UPI0011B13583|nr:hypothetical protein [Arthrobacter sp. UKPF54-2]QDY88908.1 hypothetical protein E7Y32_00700 [Arthrobacter sp. UKPF54-2]